MLMVEWLGAVKMVIMAEKALMVAVMEKIDEIRAVKKKTNQKARAN